MRALINYLRSCFCKHTYEFVMETEAYRRERDKLPMYRRRTYMCPNCGYILKFKL